MMYPEGFGAINLWSLLADAVEHSATSRPYLVFPMGRKLTIFSPSLIRATSRGRGTPSICTYQRSTNSVKASISFSRLLATGLMAGSSAASDTQLRSASTAGAILRSLPRGGGRRRPHPASARAPGGHFPDVGLGLEMIAAVAEDRHSADQTPGQQLLDGIGDVG